MTKSKKRFLLIPLAGLGCIIVPLVCKYAFPIGVMLLPGRLQILFYRLVSRLREEPMTISLPCLGVFLMVLGVVVLVGLSRRDRMGDRLKEPSPRELHIRSYIGLVLILGLISAFVLWWLYSLYLCTQPPYPCVW